MPERAVPAVPQATGLALPGSDLDIVVLNVGATLERAATGFTPVQVCWPAGWMACLLAGWGLSQVGNTLLMS